MTSGGERSCISAGVSLSLCSLSVPKTTKQIRVSAAACHWIGPRGTYTKVCAASIPVRSSRPTNTGSPCGSGHRSRNGRSAGADSGRCFVPPFSARELRRRHFVAAIGVMASGLLSADLRWHRSRAAPRGAPTMARTKRSRSLPRRPSPNSNWRKEVTFQTALFSVHARLWWAFESGAFEVGREGSLK